MDIGGIADYGSFYVNYNINETDYGYCRIKNQDAKYVRTAWQAGTKPPMNA